MWQRLAAKWVQNTWGFSWWHINLPLWPKQLNILLSSCRSEYLFSIGSMKVNQSFKCRRRKQNSGVRLWPFVTPSLPTHSFLGLLGDHVARRSHGTAAVGLFLLSWFQNLQKGKHKSWKYWMRWSSLTTLSTHGSWTSWTNVDLVHFQHSREDFLHLRWLSLFLHHPLIKSINNK